MKRDKLLEEVTRLYDIAIAKWRMTSEGTLSQAYYDGESNGIDLIKSLIIQLDEPAKVVTPQFVADEIELRKLDKYPLVSAFESANLDDWLYGNMARNVDVFARAWLDGYEIEKEPLYYVKFIDNSEATYLNQLTYERTYDGTVFLSDTSENKAYKTKFTESEIKAIDERYWQFAVPVEEEK